MKILYFELRKEFIRKSFFFMMIILVIINFFWLEWDYHTNGGFTEDYVKVNASEKENKYYEELHQYLDGKLNAEKVSYVSEEYQRYHIGSDLAMLRDVLSDIDSPTAKTLDTVLKQNMLIPYNMFIAGRLFLNDYCQWLFPILFELEKRLETELKERNAYQKRIFGFLSERLLTA